MANVDDLKQVQVISELPCYGDVPGVYPSPDNRHLAYIVPRSSIWNSTLGVMSIDGANNKTLDSPVVGWGTEIDLFWSPDSKWIAYTRAKFSGGEVTDEDEVWLAQPNTEENKLIVTLPSGWLVGWSSDSSRLYYYSGRELQVLNIDEKIAPEVLVKFELPVNIRLSPDGQKILYLEQREAKPSPPHLITMQIATRETHTVASQVRKEEVAFYNYQLHPIWSPDSSQVVYNPVVDSKYMELVAVPWDNSKETTTIRSREDVYYYPVSWSPDGRFIFTLQRPLTTDQVVPFRRILISPSEGQHEVHPISPDTLTLNFAGWLEEKD